MDWIAPSFIDLPENWKSVPGFEGIYEISDLGRVQNLITGKIVKSVPNPPRDYLRVCLHNKGKKKNYYIHVLVATVFVPNPSGLPQVNHIGLKHDCRKCMLEWRSVKGNSSDAVKRGLLGNSINEEVGVTFQKRTQKWCASYKVFGKNHWLGRFKTKEEAIFARQKAVKTIPHVA